MRSQRKLNVNMKTEFDLDLAPLLSVMVKLVPVLLLSSAFVQVMTIETELPQAVREAMAENPDKPKAAIQVVLDKVKGLEVIVQDEKGRNSETIALKDGSFDTSRFQEVLQKVKTQYPQVFRIEFSPEANVQYKDIVRLMDAARRSPNKDVRFPVYDKTSDKQILTDYMFPDVVFSNMMEG